MTDTDDKSHAPASSRGVYGISVAAELSGVGEQSLRLYERLGLLSPQRSAGGTRRYSADDLARLKRITDLLATGVNLAGVARIFALEDHNTDLRERNAGLENDNAVLSARNAALEDRNRILEQEHVLRTRPRPQRVGRGTR